MSNTPFPIDILDAAEAAERKWHVPASVSLAQWAVESAFGRHMPKGSLNPFGIKAMAGHPSVPARTREVIHGRSVMMTCRFRKFSSIAEAFDAHAELLATHEAYRGAMAHAHDPDAFAEALTGVYATDPHYGPVLIAMMHVHDLYQYDR